MVGYERIGRPSRAGGGAQAPQSELYQNRGPQQSAYARRLARNSSSVGAYPVSTGEACGPVKSLETPSLLRGATCRNARAAPAL